MDTEFYQEGGVRYGINGTTERVVIDDLVTSLFPALPFLPLQLLQLLFQLTSMRSLSNSAQLLSTATIRHVTYLLNNKIMN